MNALLAMLNTTFAHVPRPIEPEKPCGIFIFSLQPENIHDSIHIIFWLDCQLVLAQLVFPEFALSSILQYARLKTITPTKQQGR